MNRERIKGIVIGSCLTIMVLLMPISSYAASINKAIDVMYNNIKIVVEGQTVQLGKDSVGNQIEPFIYNGTTYLPVRAVGEALGMKVNWDGATSTVYLGDVPGQIKYLPDTLEPYLIDNGWTNAQNGIYKNNDGRSFSMGGVTYNNGYRLGKYNGNLNFNLDGKYEVITGDLGAIAPVENISGKNIVSIYLDDQLYEQHTVNAGDLAFNIKIPVKGVLQLRIETGYVTYANAIGFGNVIIE